MRFLNGLILLLCPICSLGAAQQVAPVSTAPANPAQAVPAQTALTFDAIARAKNGKPVTGLQQQDFTVKLDKKPQTIVGFKQTDLQPGQASPAEVILLFDTVNTQPIDVVNARKQAELYLKRNEGKLTSPVTLIVLADSGIRIMPGPTRDGNALSDTLDKAALGLRRVQDNGKYADMFRFEKSIGGLSQIATYEGKRPGKKLLIWISPGWPMLMGTKSLLSPPIKAQLFGQLVKISTDLRQAHIVLSNVDPVGTSPNGGDPISLYHDDFLKGVPTASKMEFGDLGLQTLARLTGGRVITSSNDVARAIADLASDADAFYTFTINPALPEHANEYRSVAVTTDKPGVSVTSMTGYYAQP